MKILYGVQGTGHGHISRAREIIPLLTKKADVDVLVSGYNCKMNLKNIELIRKRGISLTYDSSGRVSYLKTACNLQPITFLRDVQALHVLDYDLVISDFEPLTAWASYQKNIPCIALSHQASFVSNLTPRPVNKSVIGEQILKKFAPCDYPVGFHFQRYDSFVLPPIIRSDVQYLSTHRGRHVTVYLPAFDHEKLVQIFLRTPNIEWELFSPSCNEPYSILNVNVHPVGNKPFLDSMKTSFGVITSAGFETCAEAMFLGKKLLAIPIANQYEQYCNAIALRQMGVQTIKELDDSFPEVVQNWIDQVPVVKLSEITDTSKLVSKLLEYNKDKIPSISSDDFVLKNTRVNI